MKLSILTATYNHEKYIAQAIESVLMQETSFDYELVIGEDCSTDRTREIVIDYQKRFPDKIRLVLSEVNIGGVLIKTLEACKGEYVAIVEGDDYWTSPHKLQRQVDFLDSHPECALSFHPAMMVYEDGSREPHLFSPPRVEKEIYHLEELLEYDFIATGSVMFRRGLFGEFPNWFYEMPVGDWPLHVLNAQHGDIGYINEVMGVYRVHSGGIWSSRNLVQRLQAYIQFYQPINAYFNFQFENTVRSSILRHWNNTVGLILEQGVEQGSVIAMIGELMQVFKFWQEEFPLSKEQKSDLLGKLYIEFAFEAYNAGDLKGVRHCLPQAIRHDPSWLRNRGVWSIGVEVFLGRRLAEKLRRRQPNMVKR